MELIREDKCSMFPFQRLAQSNGITNIMNQYFVPTNYSLCSLEHPMFVQLCLSQDF